MLLAPLCKRIFSSPETTSPATLPHTLALNVAQGVNTFLPAFTKAGKPRVRMSWSKDVNLFIMRNYYHITKLETAMTTHRKQLHKRFSQQYPTINVIEQRVSNQRRIIITNKLLSENELNWTAWRNNYNQN